jgi:anti-anti-sigma factor
MILAGVPVGWRGTMRISTSVGNDGVALIEVNGRVDAHTSQRLDQALDGALAQGHNRLVLDLSSLSHISSAGLRAILLAQRQAVQHGGEVRVYGLNAQIRRIFDLVGFHDLLRMSDTHQEAMEGW